MATTSSNLVAGNAGGGQRGNGRNGRLGLKSKLAAGVAVLGCVAALIFTCAVSTGPFACQAGQSLAGTDDFATIGCVEVPGPFACSAVQPGNVPD